jgi:hypothetical protein
MGGILSFRPKKMRKMDRARRGINLDTKNSGVRCMRYVFPILRTYYYLEIKKRFLPDKKIKNKKNKFL